MSGNLKCFEQTSDSGCMTGSGFCPNCGSPVMNSTARFPESRYIHAATLGDPASFRPERVVFRAGAQPWDDVDPDLGQAKSRPTCSKGHLVGLTRNL